MDADEILEKLSQEERLELLERLIKGAAQAKEEELTIEDRVARLEKLVGVGTKRVIKIAHSSDMDCYCC